MKKLLMLNVMAFILFGCSPSVTQLNNAKGYSELIGKKMTTAQDYVVYKYQGEKRVVISKIDFIGLSSQDEVNSKKLPFVYEDKTIFGILPKGSIFEIINIEREKTFEDAHIFISAKIISEGPFKNQIVDVTFLSSGRAYEPLTFQEKYAIEVTTGAGLQTTPLK